MIKREIAIDLNDLPFEIHRFLRSGKIYDSSCSEDGQTLYCDAGFYIKTAPKGALALEAEMGKRFWRMGLGVEVMEYTSDDRDYLVTRSAEGEDLTHHLDDPENLCRVMADGLRILHSQNIAGLPVSAKLREYTDASGFSEYLCMDYFGIHSREDALKIIGANQDRLKADTFIHGDACLPNIICRDGQFRTFLDCGFAGLGDRHIDLFWVIWSLQFNLKTEDYTDRFLDLYGRENVDFDTLKTVAALEMIA